MNKKSFTDGNLEELNFRKTYFKGLGLKFIKINEDSKGQKPDGYILDSNKNKIAVAEIKLIKKQERISDDKFKLHPINIDKTILSSIREAKKQLRTIKSDLPKMVYLILGDSFASLKTAKLAIFGKFITSYCGNQKIYEGYSGFCKRFHENNKFRDDLLSAIVCYKKTLNSYEVYIFQNSDSIQFPKILQDKKHLKELWDYNSKRLKLIFKKFSPHEARNERYSQSILATLTTKPSKCKTKEIANPID